MIGAGLSRFFIEKLKHRFAPIEFRLSHHHALFVNTNIISSFTFFLNRSSSLTLSFLSGGLSGLFRGSLL